MDTTTLQPYLDRLLSGDPIMLAIVGGSVLFLLIILLVQSIRRAALRRVPRLYIDAFQLSPLGRDAFLKIRNSGDAITLTQFLIHGRSDILVKNTVTGHQLSTDGSYRILLESDGSDRLEANFEVEFFYATAARKAYRQRFKLNPIAEVAFKRT